MLHAQNDVYVCRETRREFRSVPGVGAGISSLQEPSDQALGRAAAATPWRRQGAEVLQALQGRSRRQRLVRAAAVHAIALRNVPPLRTI
jgi:hypothetical protein